MSAPDRTTAAALTPEPERAAPRRKGHGDIGLRISSVVVLLLGGVVAWQTARIRPGDGAFGPRTFPLVVAIVLLGLGSMLTVTVWRRRDTVLHATAAEEAAATHWPTVGLVVALLLAYAAALRPVGYPLATAVFIPVGARILGSKAPRRDAVAGLAVAIVLYIAFTRVFGVRLPAGVLARVLGA